MQKSKIKKIKKLQEDLVEEVLKSLPKGKVDRETINSLREIELFMGDSRGFNVQRIFQKKYGAELKRKIFESGIKEDFIFYDEPLLEDRQKGEEINLIAVIEGYFCNYRKNEKIVVLTNRTTNGQISIPAEQAARDILDWIIENKARGFIFNW